MKYNPQKTKKKWLSFANCYAEATQFKKATEGQAER